MLRRTVLKSRYRFAIAASSLLFSSSVSSALFAQGTQNCEAKPFAKATEATAFGKTAEDFSLATTNGLFKLSESFNSCDVYVVFKTFTVPAGHPLKGLSDAANNLWRSKLDVLLQISPRNVHYIFISQNADAAQRSIDQAIVQGQLNQALAPLPEADRNYWKTRFHIVSDDVTTASGAAWVSRLGVGSFVIDRFQKVRPIGIGVFSPLLQEGDIFKLATEASYANFEWDREKILSARPDTVVTAFNAEPVQAGWAAFGGTIKEVEFPGKAEMEKFDSLAIDLEIGCDGGACVYKEGNYYYDRVIEAYLCRDESDTQCDLELGRWITPFGLGGRWVHDASPLLALIKEGGKQRIRFHTVDLYKVNLKFRLGSSKGAEAPKPFAYQELFRGGKFDAAANQREPISFEVPPGTRRVEIVSTTTGHGWGKTAENCAEFCVSEHEWTVNGSAKWVNTLSEAGTPFGCLLATGFGVVPNQPGTWNFGRAGWCPGLEVQPRVWDITSLVNSSGPNQVEYRMLFNGADYNPAALPNGGVATGYDPEINLRSYVVFSR